MSRKEKRELIEFLKNAGATTVFFIEIWAIAIMMLCVAP